MVLVPSLPVDTAEDRQRETHRQPRQDRTRKYHREPRREKELNRQPRTVTDSDTDSQKHRVT